MNIVKFKIKGYDEASNSLLISFASDSTNSQDPETYTAYAFQPLTMWPDITDVAELKKRIAMAGMYHAQMQETKEKFVADPARVNSLKALVGQTHEFNVADLTVAPASTTPFQTV
jgi:hypothetical protein